MAKKREKMTVVEAGRRGGEKLRDERGRDYYVEIGKKGGASMRRVIAAGKAALAKEKGGRK